ncbi:reactive intermediate/imine deaminase [Clostridium baratii]|uniref:Reactive intermediate/imine deaminase family protein n=2 Tax=Clostridium baratii TaxID=1561 RepID=A0A0A7FZ91_9CLOT|nr:RidA family protein [Clostridium baratii]AIY84887.1 reactive intermediate/imine deaminase family protein [Clostridium baratii str. Sullivan]MBS6005549.1 RidA family protein [Clostridium baratii]MDU4910111.1 RidA family protein [Clostridium baratii]OPF52679.1 reactive intermediate/imine deaminase [Clostridium baratii]OPF56128.1 reactive intermediate/imine deaminase [Clostridium baratii]
MVKTVINTKNAPEALGPYSQAIKIGDMIFTSGQIPINPETKELVTEIKKATKQSLTNIKNILEEAGTSMDKVVKTTVFVKDLNDFAAVNEVYATFFEGEPPARSCVQVAKLPLDAPVEIEVIATM